MTVEAQPGAEYEYVVVGSGAGGGIVAARLAEAGHKVLLLEAGGDPLELEGGNPLDPDGNRLPEDYNVPAFHALSSENEAMKWDFFVRHYENDDQQQRDPKYLLDYRGRRVDGVLYPRAGTLGGCTAHNAMILIYPSNADWDYLADLTGDPSWSADTMRGYFERLENCHHRTFHRWLKKLVGLNPTRHGFKGWLSTELAIPKTALRDEELVSVLVKSAIAAAKELDRPGRLEWAVQSLGDPNDWRLVQDRAEGIRYVPLTTSRHARTSTREFLLDVARKHRLKIELDALATRVLLGEENRAIGVEYLKGAHLYRASPNPSQDPGETRTVRVSREVILAGGSFNTPQLLMLSGIGPKVELEKHGIDVRVDLPGVGQNLQDRYEVGVVNRMKRNWEVLEGSTLSRGDPQYRQWARKRKGVYKTNGAVLSVITRSNPTRPVPDLFLFTILGPFRGYFPGYSALFAKRNYLTWAVLKGHTNNTAGSVSLRSADPRDTPLVDFRYFGEGNDTGGEDLESVVDGIEFVREMAAKIDEFVEEEELPGKGVASRDDLRQFVKDHAWGHHASGTCAIGSRDRGGVLNGDFQVHGTQGLRVVDASIFPRIPGLFIVSAVFMIGEKASDVILADARAS